MAMLLAWPGLAWPELALECPVGSGCDLFPPPCLESGSCTRVWCGAFGGGGELAMPWGRGSLSERAGMWTRRVLEVKVVSEIRAVKPFHFIMTIFYYYHLFMLF